MSNPLVPVDIDINPADFLDEWAPWLQPKVDITPRTPEQINLYVSKHWGDFVDDFIIRTQARLAKRDFHGTEYGVVGDGVVDDWDAIMTTRAKALASDGNGGVVLLPPGVIKISSPIPLTTNVIYKGAGKGATIIKANFTGPIFVSVNTTDPNPPDVDEGVPQRIFYAGVEDLSIDNTSYGNAGGTGIDMSNCKWCHVHRVSAYNIDIGFRIIGRAYHNEISEFDAQGGGEFEFGTCGIYVGGAANANFFSRCSINTMKTGIHVTDGFVGQYTNNCMFEHCIIEAVEDYGINLNATHDQGVDRITIINPRIEGYETAVGIRIPAFARTCLVYNPYLSALLTDFINDSVSSRIDTFATHNFWLMDRTNHVSAGLIQWVGATSTFSLARNIALSLLANLECNDITSKGDYIRGDRPAFNRGSNLDETDIALSAEWGNAAEIVFTGVCKDTGGMFKVIANGAGIAAQPYWTLTYRDGPWADGVPRTIVAHNGGDAVNNNPRWFPAANQLLTVLVQTPVAGEEFSFNYLVTG